MTPKDGVARKTPQRLLRLPKRRQNDASPSGRLPRGHVTDIAVVRHLLSLVLLLEMPRHPIGEDGRMQHGLMTFAGNPYNDTPPTTPQK